MTDQIVFPDSTPESQHPVLANLKNQIDELEIAKNNLLNSIAKERNERFAYVARVKNVLVEVAQNYDGDKETIVNIANNLDIDLSRNVTMDLNLTIRVQAEVPFDIEDDEIEDKIESDLDLTVSGYEFIQDGWVESMIWNNIVEAS
jgi:hypothetical protein